MIKPLITSGEAFDKAKASFAYHTKGVRGMPEQLVWETPTRIQGPQWVSAMWYGWLLRTQSTAMWRHPDFEGQFIAADVLVDQGYTMHEQSAECGQYELRVGIDELTELLNNGDESSEETLNSIRSRIEAARKRFAERDKHKPKKGKAK